MSEWRYRCPNGHADWRVRSNGYVCRTCNESFDELVDMKREND